MNLEDLIRETWSALTANRGRSALTILGIVIGIGAVITMNAIIGGVSEVQARVLGANASRIVNISIKGLDGFGEDDVDALMQNVRGYDYIVTKTSEARPSVSTDAKKLDGTIVGATSNYFQSHAYEVLAGELYGKDEEDMASRVAVLSETTVKLLWGCSNAEAVGKALRIDGDMYRVVAVTDKINSWEEYMPDTAFAVVPYSTACVRITGDTSIGQMEGMTSAGFDIDTVMSDTESYLAQRYRLSAGSEDEESARKVTIDSNKSTIESLNASMSSFQDSHLATFPLATCPLRTFSMISKDLLGSSPFWIRYIMMSSRQQMAVDIVALPSRISVCALSPHTPSPCPSPAASVGFLWYLSSAFLPCPFC